MFGPATGPRPRLLLHFTLLTEQEQNQPVPVHQHDADLTDVLHHCQSASLAYTRVARSHRNLGQRRRCVLAQLPWAGHTALLSRARCSVISSRPDVDMCSNFGAATVPRDDAYHIASAAGGMRAHTRTYTHRRGSIRHVHCVSIHPPEVNPIFDMPKSRVVRPIL